MPVTPLDARRKSLRATSAAIGAGALGSALGVAASVLGVESLGLVLTLGSALLLGWGLHRFGRQGPDPPGWFAQGEGRR